VSIPIVEAKRISKNYNMRQVIIVALSNDGTQHVATYGKSMVDCDQAAQGGDFVKKALGWPESLAQMPNRVKQLQDQVKSLKAQLKASDDINATLRGTTP